MFARPSSSAHVCLRCRLGLARQLRIRPTPSQHLYASSAASAAAAGQDGDESHGAPGFRKPYKPFKDRYPLGKVRGRQGKEVREDTAPLEIDSLGEPSEVIVLRDANIDAPRRQSGSQDGQREKESPSINEDILGSISQEKDAPEQEAVDEQLEGLRPSQEDGATNESVVLSQGEFGVLFKEIHDGFTKEQLGKYVASRQSMRGLGKNGAKTLKGK
ncbi:hypothetical protein LTS18_013054, partial [Coniosporium uncinatum]